MAKEEKITTNSILSSKSSGRKISMLTAYDYIMASIIDEAGIDIVLVGDSLGNVMLGYKDTIPVTMQEMVIHTQAVSRGVSRSLVVSDMPFGSFQKNKKDAVSNAIALVKAGAHAVKIEGIEYLTTIRDIIKTGIPVMGHLGFTPQSVNILGYKKQGKTAKEQAKLLKDAKLLEKAGCFAIVVELIPDELAAKITRELNIPVIGCGAGPYCDGTVMVLYDMLGIYPDSPCFVKKYANLADEIKTAVKKYIEDVK